MFITPAKGAMLYSIKLGIKSTLNQNFKVNNFSFNKSKNRYVMILF